MKDKSEGVPEGRVKIYKEVDDCEYVELRPGDIVSYSPGPNYCDVVRRVKRFWPPGAFDSVRGKGRAIYALCEFTSGDFQLFPLPMSVRVLLPASPDEEEDVPASPDLSPDR